MKSCSEFWGENRPLGWPAGWLGDVEGIRARLASVHTMPEMKPGAYVDEFREAVGLYSFALSRLGVAPRWQGLIGWLGTPRAGGGCRELMDVMDTDARLYDLVWLREEFGSELKTSMRLWQGLSGEKGSLVYGAKERGKLLELVDSSLSGANLVKRLGLEDWRQAGCIDLIEKPIERRVWKLSAMIEVDEEEEFRRLKRMAEGRKTDVARQFALLRFAARVSQPEGEDDGSAPERWTNVDRVFRWVTGRALGRANVYRTLTTRRG